MPRAERQLEPHVIQHLMWHGNRSEVIFSIEEDFRFFVELLERFTAYYAIKLYGYCLMVNHIHMIAEPTRDNLPFFMQRIGHKYATTFNVNNDLLGHVFSGRYRPVAITTDEHFMAVSRYIHLNPVKARLVERPEDYTWSSCREYLGLRSTSFVQTERVLSDYFTGIGGGHDQAVESYRSFLYERLEDEGLPKISKIGGIWIYEDKPASADIQAEASQFFTDLECRKEMPISLVFSLVEQNWCRTHQLPSGLGHDANDQRDTGLYLARTLTGATYAEIAESSGMQPSTARIAVNRFRKKLTQRAWLRKQTDQLASLVLAAADS